MIAGARIVGRAELGQAAWDASVGAETGIAHRFALQEARGLDESWEELGFAVVGSNGRALALMPLLARPLRVLGVARRCVLQSPGGPALMAGLGERERQAVHRLIVDELGFIAAERGALWAEAETMAAGAVNPLAPYGYVPEDGLWHEIELGDEIEAAFAAEGRAALRKSEHGGLVAAKAEDGEGEALAALWRENALPFERAAPPRRFAEQWLLASAGDRVETWLVREGAQPLAAAVLALESDRAWLWLWLASVAGRGRGAEALVLAAALRSARAQGIRRCVLGPGHAGQPRGAEGARDRLRRDFGGQLATAHRGRLWFAPRMAALSRLGRTLAQGRWPADPPRGFAPW
ncbi:MAG: GNAT family N-acetyltransferase [Alphaproteobacteria bacterium]|nr:GNAT family N-acetyltransferase [Alphaproteobacteria bacterium]